VSFQLDRGTAIPVADTDGASGAGMDGRLTPHPPRDLIAGAEAVLQLLSTANLALESDHNTARACIARAAALLRKTEPDTGRTPQMKNPRGHLATWQQRRLLIYINAHLGARMEAAELAILVDLSVGHFSRVFRRTFGDAPMAFVAKQRMQRAQELMLDTQEPLAHIALACGVCDQAHFTRVFRKIVGMTPLAWRRLHATSAHESTGSRGLSGHVRRTTEKICRPGFFVRAEARVPSHPSTSRPARERGTY
jgi:AraC family transcriptional regulator